MHLRLGLASSLCVDIEVGWSAHLHTWNTRASCQIVLLLCIKARALKQCNGSGCECKYLYSIDVTTAHLSCWGQALLLSPFQHRGKDPLSLWTDLLEFPEEYNYQVMKMKTTDNFTARPPQLRQKLFSYLICKQHHDGISAWTGWSVLDSEGVIVILDDVKVDVSFGRPNHPRGAFYSNADVP